MFRISAFFRDEVYRSAAILDETMERANYAMNKDKAVAVLGFGGPGSVKATKQISFEHSPMYGAPARHGRYVGPQSSQFALEHAEVRNRIQATKTAWTQLGRIWRKRFP